MNKMIIQNDTDITDLEALRMIIMVVKEGRISNKGNRKQYCFVTQVVMAENDYTIIADLNKKSDKFIIRKRYE